MRMISGGRAPSNPVPAPTGVLTECFQLLTQQSRAGRTSPDAWSDTGLPTSFHSSFRPAVLAGRATYCCQFSIKSPSEAFYT